MKIMAAAKTPRDHLLSIRNYQTVFSAIYKGRVRHRRFIPGSHEFCYSVFMVYLDLTELDEIFALSRWWSDKRRRPAQFRRCDFLGDPDTPLCAAVRKRVLEETGVIHTGPIRMLANLRYFGYIINPITCYYCFDAADNLQFIVLEVTNTPWKERISYVLTVDSAKPIQRIRFDKGMHVSPFNPMNMRYHWMSNQPDQKLSFGLQTWCDDELRMDATAVFSRIEMSSGNLTRVLVSNPLMTIKVGTSIYWQALKLWLKRSPVYDHPGAMAEQTQTDHSRGIQKS